MNREDLFPFDSTEFKQRVLERTQLRLQYPISAYVANSACFDLIEMTGEKLLMTIMAEVLTDHVETLRQTAKLNVPATWWQHFKQDHEQNWFMRKLIKRRPIRYTTWSSDVIFERLMRYPDARIALPESQFGHPVICESVTHGDWSTR